MQTNQLTNATLEQVSIIPLEHVQTPFLTTVEAAHYLNRKPQTLRCWSMNQSGPLQPVRLNGIGGPLCWRTVDVKRLAGLA